MFSQTPQFIDGMSMIGIHYHCIRHMTMFMNSSNFKTSTVILTQVVVVVDFPATVNLNFLVVSFLDPNPWTEN